MLAMIESSPIEAGHSKLPQRTATANCYLVEKVKFSLSISVSSLYDRQSELVDRLAYCSWSVSIAIGILNQISKLSAL